ncbi:MAG: hypothetical protein AVDCRST_MAG59-1911 [uncultured Thermomicrobiales bacterium]|uniref:Uncharacterized protein n=1 Tax=uncultured Thermomicrobiales bacterium TaxID=1645740 RepID=A0A6J4UM04_9BACT|nr:MAG: hypothetical protein AVDCRST_MAG59-1911 [uncultured Thermomicrobiales bacterium]
MLRRSSEDVQAVAVDWRETSPLLNEAGFRGHKKPDAN